MAALRGVSEGRAWVCPGGSGARPVGRRRTRRLAGGCGRRESGRRRRRQQQQQVVGPCAFPSLPLGLGARPLAQCAAPAAPLRVLFPPPPAAPSPPVHVPARGAPGLLLPCGWALGRAAGRGPGRRGRRRPGAAAAPATAALVPGRAAAPGAASLRGHRRRRRGAGPAARALLPPGRRRRRRGPGLGAAARSPAAVARSAAADPGLLHGGTQLRGAVAEQLPAGEELVPVLGRLLGECRACPARLGRAHPGSRGLRPVASTAP